MAGEHSYFMSHIFPVYKRAMVWDDNLCLIVQGEYGLLYSYSTALNRSKSYIVGSCSDGGCSPRIYRTSPVLEVDLLVLTDGTGENHGQQHPDKVGVYLKRHFSRQLWWDQAVIYSSDFVESPAPDSPKHVRDAYHKLQDMINSNRRYYPKWYKKLKMKQSTKGPSHKLSFIRYNISIHLDYVLAYHHQGWPQEAEEWKTRARLWPPASVVEQVVQQGCQIVAKWSSSTGDIDGPMENHITFALCERYLARNRTTVQKLVYLMAKTLFYTYLNLHDDGNPNIDFPSYALKTCMMWLMEQTPLDRWRGENVPFLLRELLTLLRVSVDSGYLKNYFMIEANVLSNCTSDLLEKVNNRLASILSNTNNFLQETALYQCNILLYGYHAYTGGNRAYDKVVYECQNKVLGYGLWQAIDKVHMAKAKYQCIIDILKQGRGEDLQAKGYLFDEEECFHILKVMMKIGSTAYITMIPDNLQLCVRRVLHKHFVNIDNLIDDVLCFEKHLSKPEVTIIRLCVQWQDWGPVKVQPTCGWGKRCKEVLSYLQHNDECNYKMSMEIVSLLGETDLVVVRERQDINVYKWSDIGDLIEQYVRDLWDKEAGRWVPKIFSLTHRDIPELQLMDFARMLYLLYVCDDKRAPD